MHRIPTILVLTLAILLRLLLCWENPPDNAFDDHFEPVSLILQKGQIPDKDDCFQCYHPPVFYYASALVAHVLNATGMTLQPIIKSLQFLNCFFNILTLPMIYLILKRFRLSELSRFLAFSVICLLPRHIYMSAMHSNDSLTYLAVALCTYLLLVTIDRKLSWPFATLLGMGAAMAIFVKYTAFIVLPMIAAPLIVLTVFKSDINRSKCATALLLALLPPLLLLGSYMATNFKDYGRLLPFNDNMIDTNAVHPRDPDGVSFVSFTPWQYIKEPIIIPGQMHSFWTLIYSSTWIDSEPRFTNFIEGNDKWWSQYFAWMRGETFFPISEIPISNTTRILTAGLIICGLIPLGLIIIGLIQCARLIVQNVNSGRIIEAARLICFPVALGFNAIGIILLTLKAPVYSSMKATYFLTSIPAFALFISFGLQYLEEARWLRIPLSSVFFIIIILSFLNILQSAWALP